MFDLSLELTFTDNINKLTKKLQIVVAAVINETVLWVKSVSKFKLYWNNKCAVVVTKVKRKRKTWIILKTKEAWKAYFKAFDDKKKIIVKKKKLNFRRTFVKFIVSSNNLWRFARSARTQSYKFKKIPKMFSLKRFNNNDTKTTISSFKKKTALLFNMFLFYSVLINFIDIVSYCYFNVVIEKDSLTIPNEIKAAIKRCKLDSVLNFD